MRKTLIATATVLLAAGLVWAAGRPGIVRTKDGSVYDGMVEEKDDTVTINVRGIQTAVPRERIDTITYGEFEDRWNEAYAKLAANDVKGRIQAGRRAFDERRYDLAEKALKDAQAIDPNDPEASELLKLTQNQRRLEKSTTGSETTGNSGTGTPPVGGTTAGWKTLDAEQIDKIKRIELSDSDRKATVRFLNNVLKKYHDSDPNIGMNFTEFSRQPSNVKALMIIKNGGDLAKDVEITNDPETMLNFRKDVLPLVQQGCATSACHGGNNDASKAFAMITPSANSAEVYTNYYVLHKFKKNVSESAVEGMFNATYASMIDRVHPDSSLLLQYGLPEQNADHKHPKVRGYNGIFNRAKEDPKYKTISNWLSSLNRLEPEYKIDFKLERKDAAGASPTTSPAGEAVKGALEGVKNLVK